MNNTIAGWLCGACGAKGIRPRVPSSCPTCGDSDVQKRLLRSPNICVCEECGEFYAMTLGVFNVPTDEEAAALWAD